MLQRKRRRKKKKVGLMAALPRESQIPKILAATKAACQERAENNGSLRFLSPTTTPMRTCSRYINRSLSLAIPRAPPPLAHEPTSTRKYWLKIENTWTKRITRKSQEILSVTFFFFYSRRASSYKLSYFRYFKRSIKSIKTFTPQDFTCHSQVSRYCTALLSLFFFNLNYSF